MRVGVGSPMWDRALCLDLTGSAESIVVFAEESMQSRSFTPAYGSSDRVDFGVDVLRLPFSDDISAIGPASSEMFSPLCQGVFPMGTKSPMWMFYPNVTVSISSVVFGDGHREFGKVKGFDSPVLSCEFLAPGLCTTRARIEGDVYDVVLDSGTSRTVVPPWLYDKLIVDRSFGGGEGRSTTFDMAFPPDPADIEDCVQRYDALGFNTGGRCGDHSGQFVLHLPLQEYVGGKQPNPHEVLLMTDGTGLTAPRDANSSGTVWLGVNVWKHIRAHVNHYRGEMVLQHHHVDGNMSVLRAVLVLFVMLALLYSVLADTRWVWSHTKYVTFGTVFAIFVEAFIFASSIYAIYNPTSRRAFSDSARWVYPFISFLVWTSVVAFAGMLFMFVMRLAETGAHISALAINYHPRDKKDFHRTERLFMARKFFVLTAGFLGLWMLILERRQDNMGDDVAVVAVLLFFLTHVCFLSRLLFLEVHAVSVGGERGSGLWLVFVVVVGAIIASTTMLGCGLTVYTYTVRVFDYSQTVVLLVVAGFFMISFTIAMTLLSYIETNLLLSYSALPDRIDGKK